MTDISQHLSAFDAYFTTCMQDYALPCSRLKEALCYATLGSGKRMRPLLIVLCADILALPVAVSYPVAAAMECMHTYSLVHDDLPAMDDDDLRRGRPSVHRAFDEATAILVGDGLQAFALECLFTLEGLLPAGQLVQIARQIVRAAGCQGMVGGQSLDLQALSQKDVTLPVLQKIHYLKTGRLLEACVEAVISADSHKEHTEIHAILRSCIQTFGLVYQIQDDYHDRFGTSTLLGKTPRLDQKNHKITYCSFYNKKELLQLIKCYYESIYAVLDGLGDKGKSLRSFLESMRIRSG